MSSGICPKWCVPSFGRLRIINTVKLQGRSAWDYLGKFFTGIFNGCRDFLSLAPQNMNLAVCQ